MAANPLFLILKRVLSSWPTFTGSLLAIAETVYLLGWVTEWIAISKEQWAFIMEVASVVLASLYILFTIRNNLNQRHSLSQ